MNYEKPELLLLNSNTAFGATCVPGGTAVGDYCNPGSAAGTYCTTGNSALTQYCTSGNSAGDYCSSAGDIAAGGACTFGGTPR